MAKDPYEVLGLPRSATEEEVRAAYRRLAQQYSGGDYSASPLSEDASQKMEEINTAFDEIMAILRTGSASSNGAASADQGGADNGFLSIRQMINGGNVDAALNELQQMPPAARNAEWYFLCGSAYYYKGWLGEAQQFFRQAVQMDPQNKEYAAALNRLNNQAAGNMAGNPYGQYADGQMVGCSPCDLCSTLMCINCMCGGGRGGCC